MTRSQLHILLLEDMTVIRTLLQDALSGINICIDAVSNGLEGVQRFQESRYDVVLTDIQMPVKDGLSATREMRQIEARTQRKRAAIIGLTAGAAEFSEARCLAAGMDAYFTKPFDLSDLRQAISKLTGFPIVRIPMKSKSVSARRQTRRSFSSDSDVLHVESALRRLDGDEELYRKLVTFFIEDHHDLLCAIERGLEANNAAQIRQAAHSLKGSAGGIGGTVVQKRAESIERASREGKLDDMDDSVAQLKNDLTSLITELEPYR